MRRIRRRMSASWGTTRPSSSSLSASASSAAKSASVAPSVSAASTSSSVSMASSTAAASLPSGSVRARRAARPSSPSSSSASSRFMEPGRGGVDSRGARAGKCASRDPEIWRNLRSKCPKRRPSWHAARVFRSPVGANERTQRDTRRRGFGRRDMFTDNRCANRVITGAALGATVGGAVGAVYGTYESFAYKVRRRYFLALDSSPNRRSRATPADRCRRNRHLTFSPPAPSPP